MALLGKVSSGCRCDLLAHTTPFSFASSWRVGVTKSDVQGSVSAEEAQPSLSHNMALPSLHDAKSGLTWGPCGWCEEAVTDTDCMRLQPTCGGDVVE